MAASSVTRLRAMTDAELKAYKRRLDAQEAALASRECEVRLRSGATEFKEFCSDLVGMGQIDAIQKDRLEAIMAALVDAGRVDFIEFGEKQRQVSPVLAFQQFLTSLPKRH